MDTRAGVSALIGALADSLFWFKLDDSARLVAEGYARFNSAVLGRVRQRIEIERIELILTHLSLYEYSRIEKHSKQEIGNARASISNVGKDCLFDFARALTKLPDLPKTSPSNAIQSRTTPSQTVATKTRALLRHENPLVCFLTWFLVFSLVFAPIVTLILKLLSMSLDSTILIGIISVPFAGAVAIAAAIHTKQLDKP